MHSVGLGSTPHNEEPIDVSDLGLFRCRFCDCVGRLRHWTDHARTWDAVYGLGVDHVGSLLRLPAKIFEAELLIGG